MVKPRPAHASGLAISLTFDPGAGSAVAAGMIPAGGVLGRCAAGIDCIGLRSDVGIAMDTGTGGMAHGIEAEGAAAAIGKETELTATGSGGGTDGGGCEGYMVIALAIAFG